MGNKIPCLHSTEDSPVKTSNNFNKKPVNGNFQDQIYPQTFKTNQIDPKKNQKPIIMEETKKEDPSAKSKNHSSEEKKLIISGDIGKQEKYYENPEKEEENRKNLEKIAEEEKEKRKIQSMEFKNRGNVNFGKREYDQAIQNYTQAIILFEESIYFSNRAMCFKNVKDFQKAKEDASKALEIDENNLKAMNILGISLIEIGKFDESIAQIKSGINCFEDILLKNTLRENAKSKCEKNLIIGKKILCLKENSIQQIKKSEIQQFILDMIEDDNTYESSYKENIKSEVDFLLNGISKKFIIPDFLTCKISFNIIDEPALTPEGFTYEKKDLTQHLEKGGYFDPLSRSHLTAKQLLPNENIKNATKSFLKENPWAMISDYELDLEKITFED